MLTLGMTFCGICGLLKAFMTTYVWFLVFEFLDAAFGSGTYVCGFVLGKYPKRYENSIFYGLYFPLYCVEGMGNDKN